MEFINTFVTYHHATHLSIEATKCSISKSQTSYCLQYYLSAQDAVLSQENKNLYVEFNIHHQYFDKYDCPHPEEGCLSNLCVVTQSKLNDLINCKLTGFQRKIFLESTFLFLLYQLCKTYHNPFQICINCDIVQKSIEKDKIDHAKKYILKHLSESLTISSIASAIGTNDCYLKKGFKEHTGFTVFEFIQENRMAHAKLLLKNTEKSIREIALEVGYSSISSFSQAFKHYVGLSPKTYTKQAFSEI